MPVRFSHHAHLAGGGRNTPSRGPTDFPFRRTPALAPARRRSDRTRLALPPRAWVPEFQIFPPPDPARSRAVQRQRIACLHRQTMERTPAAPSRAIAESVRAFPLPVPLKHRPTTATRWRTHPPSTIVPKCRRSSPAHRRRSARPGEHASVRAVLPWSPQLSRTASLLVDELLPLLHSFAHLDFKPLVAWLVILAMLGQVLLFDDVPLEIVSILVSLAVAEPLGALVVRVLEMLGNGERPSLFHIGLCAPNSLGAGVRFGRGRAIHRRFRQRQFSFRPANKFHRVMSRDSQHQRLGIGQADVLRRQDGYAPRDKSGVFTRDHHFCEPV